MRSKKVLLENSRIYLVLDREVCGYQKLFSIAREAIKAEISIIQLRDKKGSPKEILEFFKRLVRLTKKNKTLFILNDRVDLAFAAGAWGVHLGQEDLSLVEARKILGSRALIGISCQTLEQALKAEEEGADYIGFGSVFKTLTKPKRDPMNLGLLQDVVKKIQIPVFAIGGINLSNIAQLRQMGVKRVAVCRAICEARDVRKTVEEFKERLELTKERINFASLVT